jgi:hypothetical protein
LLLLLIFLTLGIIFQYIPISVIDYSFTNINQTYHSLINYDFVNIANKMESGLNGIVSFIGQECNPEAFKKTPPCSGPYPNYEILVYDEDGKNVIAKTETNDKGEYFISLEPRNYVIYTPHGFSNQSYPISIKENEITKQDLIIDKGIR